ncbi:outer membrane beta-barrel protein [Fodinibius halophilus]|uniref:Porin family protein n=1 Tax=Fodinibius halophilus TaxID=1736908 RepID=A0A6M1TG05_9BACT|nr:outer membrane beta-barrel protein [Fodinibius halophilus]NGP89042.1 porin family protein [Fodinibius halophilus]
MKKIILLVIVLVGLEVAVKAQSSSKLRFYAGSGITLPIHSDHYDNFEGNWSPGYNINFGIGYVFSPVLTLSTTVDFSRVNFDENYFAGFYQLGNELIYENANLKSTWGGTASLRISPFPDRPIGIPFFKIGVGASQFREVSQTKVTSQNIGTEVTVSETFRNWGPTASLGAGFKFNLSNNLHLLAEVNYKAWFDANGNSPTQYLPIEIGIEF